MLDKSKTNPGFHKNFAIERFTDREQDILLNLEKWWYLTSSGRSVTLGANAKLSYFLMKPVTSFAELFNLDREIICVFSPYINFEPRTLDAFDHAEKAYQKLRTETVCRVVVSDDEQVESKISNLLKSDPEQPIVIPFTYNELINCKSEHFIKNRFAKHFFTRDLFAFLSPLKRDLYFFGRSGLIQQQISRHRSGEHSSLFGLRKSGKTSIIYAVERALSVTGDKVITIDCESPSVHQLTWNELLKRVVLQYAEVLNVKLRDINEYNFDTKNAADSFEKLALKIYRAKQSSRTLFIFDEIERISPGTASSHHWREGVDFIYFWQTLRAFYQRHSDVFTYMLVGTNPSCVENGRLNGHENPLFNSVPSTYIPAFTVEQVREMVRKLGRYMGLKFDETIYYKLHEDFGGHPFLVRQFCSELHKQIKGERPQKIDKPRYESVKSDFDPKIGEYLEMIVQVLREWYRDEYDVLTYLANDDYESFNEFAYEHPQYTQHLLGYEILQKGESGYSFRIESAKKYLQGIYKYHRINLSDEEKWAEISERRNKVERALRQCIRQVLRISLGKIKGCRIVLAAIPENRRAQLSQIEFDSLLCPSNSPLFLLELSNLINKNWTLFENIFSKEKAFTNVTLREVNHLGRPDAHAKSMSEEDFTQVRLHLNYLEKCLDDWIS